MRATIEIPDHLRAAILAVAARKGYRGYSRVIVEALEFYLAEKETRESGVGLVLEAAGSWKKHDAGAVRKRIAEVRKNWKTE